MSKVQDTAPDTIWLQLGDDDEILDYPFLLCEFSGEITWSAENGCSAHEIEYTKTSTLTPGSLAAIEERHRQIHVEGFTTEHDAEYYAGRLIEMAVAYCISADDCLDAAYEAWPVSSQDFKPTTPLKDLTKAAALIIAEIDRRIAAGEKE